MRTRGAVELSLRTLREASAVRDAGGPEICTRIYLLETVYTAGMGKHLVDIDERALRGAREELGTHTIKDTVNRALRQAAGSDDASVKERLDLLARADLARREDAWR
jgi:Arc/MetJ family transcription regulator